MYSVLTQPLFVIIFSNATCFDQADHYYQVFILYKNLKRKTEIFASSHKGCKI
jgi:hypothetical protein